MPIATGDSGVSRVAGAGELGMTRARAGDGRYWDVRLLMTACIGRRSDSVMDVERPVSPGDGEVAKCGCDVADTRLALNSERRGSALVDSDVNEDCESANRLLPPRAEEGDVSRGLDWGLGLGTMLTDGQQCREADLGEETLCSQNWAEDEG